MRDMNNDIEVKHSEIGNKGLFVLKRDGKRMGRLEYQRLSSFTISAQHTEVDKGFEGQGVAKRLFSVLVGWARENDQKIEPLCPFFKSMFDRNPDVKEELGA